MSWTLYDEFAGCGGLTQGAAQVPGIEPKVAANHDRVSVASHQANFPAVEHFCDDVRELDLAKFPRCDLFHASPICPPFCDARGKPQYFDADTQGVLFEDELGAVLDEGTRRGRLLMHEVPRYLEAMALRGRPVTAGTVENVVQARRWSSWHAWRQRIESCGYQTQLIAVNSMHLHPQRTKRPPQSRDRLLLMYWLKTIGRRPDLDKWMLRPTAWCPTCDQQVNAMQVFKDPGCDMGRYGRYGQYWYRCPHRTCRNTIVHPQVPAAAEAIDWTLPAVKIGERTDSRGRPDPLASATITRIRGGIDRHYGAMLVPAGGTWRTDATPLYAPMPARTTRESDGLAVATDSFIMRNNGSKGDGREHCTPVTEPIRTLTTKGHQSLVSWDLLVPYYSNGRAHPATLPMGALSTRDRYALASGDRAGIDISDVRFRMLATKEIAAGMGFAADYIVLGTVKQRTRQLGQAITPCLGEAAYSAIIECISGEELERAT
jgi:DNA (cytosine-5)-methyltransferase 1